VEFEKIRTANEHTPVFDGEVVVDPETDDIYACTALRLTGHGPFQLSVPAMANLRRYLENGGFLTVEPCCADADFDNSARALLKAMLPARKLGPIPLDDPVYAIPFDLRKKPAEGTDAYRGKLGKQWPVLLGIRDGNRWSVIFCPVDYSCAIADDLDEEIIGLRIESAYQLFMNIACNGIGVIIPIPDNTGNDQKR
jgi:hypothetical protein